MRPGLNVKLSTCLAVLVLGAVVPLLVFGGLALRGILQTSRALADRGQVDTSRALALAVDGEVRAWKAALAALAESKSNQPGRLSEFYEEARHVAAQHEGWVVLTAASRKQLFNTLLPYGAPLQETSSPETIDAIFREGKPIVSDLIWGKNAQRYLVAVAVPVVRGGKVVHCLTLNFSPDRLTRLLLRQQFPASWVAAINDRQRTVVARSVLADTRVGKPVVSWFAAASRAAESGLVTGPLMDGRLGQIAFQRLQEVPWIVALVVPAADLQSAAPIWGFVSAGTLLGLLAVGLAVAMGRTITGPVRRLARASEGLLRGEGEPLRSLTGIEEVRELEEALGQASIAARTHAEERERAAEALQQANQILETRVVERTAALASANEALQEANADLQAEVAQRAQAEESLRRQAQLLDLSHDAIVVWELAGAIEYWNAGAEALYGYARDEAVGRGVHDLLATFHPQGMTACEADLERAGEWQGELLQLTKADRVVAVESHMVLVPRAGRRLVLETSRDITARHQAEAALRTNAERLRLASAAADLGVFEWRMPQDSVLWENDRMYEIFGRTRADGPLSHAALVGATLHPADAPGFESALAHAMQPDRVFHTTCRIRRPPDGAVRWLEFFGRFDLATDGQPVRLVGVVADITERKQAEAEMQSLARFPSENPHPVLRVNGDGVILYANEAAAAVMQTWRCAVGGSAPAPWPDTVRDALTQPSRKSIDVPCADRVYTFSLGAVPEAGYVNLYGSDITERKRAEDTLQQTLAELRRSNHDLEQFASVASHDLQEPLRMVVGFTQLLARRYQDRLDADAREFIRFAVDGATRMQRLILDLLAYARVTRRAAGPEAADAAAALQAALQNLQAAIQDTGAQVTAEALPIVRGDGTQLTQVFQNLIGNALKFHGEAPPRVHVTATPQDDAWLFAVQDHGIGIEPQYFERIFRIFQRLHPTDRYPGTGIGLALCQRIVERHGGRIWVESTPGHGATFFFTLPRPEGKAA